MAKVSYVDLLSGSEELYFKTLQPGDRFTYSRVRKKNVFFSNKRKKGVSERSLLPQISDVWNGLTILQKNAWTNAGARCNLNGWRTFVRDMSACIKNDIVGVPTPSLYHQGWFGLLHIEAPATELKIVQLHPRNYYVYKKVSGTKSQYSPILVTEQIALPLQLSLNYRSELEAVGPNPVAKIYARVWYSYQGVNLYRDIEINFDLISDWTSDIIKLSSIATILIGYNLYIELSDVQGDLYIDNVNVFHSGQNWCRDPFCQDINQGFTKAFYQIPKHWAGVNVPEGAFYESTYFEF